MIPSNPHHRLGRLAAALALAGAALALAGCASPSYPITDEARVQAEKDSLPPPAAGDFPDVSSASWVQGTFPNTESLRALRTGMGKDQVRDLLGVPHFREGLAGVHAWNYIFHFRTGPGPDFVTCQYMVRYDDDMITSGLYWKNPDCAMYVNPPVVRPLPAVSAAPAPAPLPAAVPAQKVTLGTDGLFRFDGAGRADLLPAGRVKIESLVSEIQRGFKRLDAVTVTGHTDRLGTDAYNDTLSLARANTVRELLVQRGIASDAVHAAGMGKRQPVVTDCEGTRPTPALVNCLQPNRRVEIAVAGER